MNKFRNLIIRTVLITSGLCVLLAAIPALTNLNLPEPSDHPETLTEADKIRLSEAFRLRENVGDEVWPGWGQADIPAILYNHSYAFLIGFPEPPDGWIKVPQGSARGGPWNQVGDDLFDGDVYYHQELPPDGLTPEAFAVLVGDKWTSSIATYNWAQRALVETIRSDLPTLLRPVFPYRLFINQLLQSEDQYVSLIDHEAFHAFQGQMGSEKLAGAERINIRVEADYPWEDEVLQDAWQAELDLLSDALQLTDPQQLQESARRFLALREARRADSGLSAQAVNYEQQREWLEGLARYAELEVWRLGASDRYTPHPETEQLSDFDKYSDFDGRWQRELEQMRRMATDDGDGRFYYTGMAQAYLLDRLQPDWKMSAFDEGVWLEDLIADALGEANGSGGSP